MESFNKFPRGSEWRKWDLHAHTPIDHEWVKKPNSATESDKKQFAKEYIDFAKSENLSVIAITDHNFCNSLDQCLIPYIQEEAQKNKITILPGFEITAKDGSGIHILCIFNEDTDLDKIKKIVEQCFNAGVELIPQNGTIPVSNKSIEEIEKIIQDSKQDSILIFAHAERENGVLDSRTIKGERRVQEWKNSCVNIAQIAKSPEEYTEGFMRNVINQEDTNYSREIAYINASDCRTISKDNKFEGRTYLGEKFTWIKADPTFEGLKQIIYEPKERIKITELKPEEKAGYQVINSVKIFHKDFSQQTIELNQNLNSIIGGRSTGKSILLGCIAKKLNSLQEVKYDNDEYTDYVNEIVPKIEISWKDNVIDDNRDIEYFPQSYMYKLAKDKNKLNNLIENIIKQDPIKNNLINLYKSFCSNNNTEITNKINKLFQLHNDLKDKNTLLKEIGDKKGIETEIERLTKELLELKDKSKITQEDLSKYNKLKDSYDNLYKQLQNITEEILKIENLKTKFFTNNDIEFELVALADENKEIIKTSFDKLKIQFQDQWELEISTIIKSNEKQKQIILDYIDTIRLDPIYKIGLLAFQNNTQFKSVEEKLKIQKDKLADISKIDKELTDLQNQIDTLKKGIIDANQNYIYKINEIKANLSITKDVLKINATAHLRKKEFKDILNWSINQKGEQGKEIVNGDIQTNEDFLSKISNLFDKLIINSITLKGGYTNIGLTKELLGKNFFSISYDITYDTDSFSQMSEGKKAFVILMLLLDFSTKDCPILIDQPEDDLDNRAIYRELVVYLKKKKKDRQIIVVTHNPNIVVSADSELVIVANQNGTGTPNLNNSKFQYISGSLEFTKRPTNTGKKNDISSILESQGIREHVCEILEGGSDAFKKREEKYHIR